MERCRSPFCPTCQSLLAPTNDLCPVSLTARKWQTSVTAAITRNRNHPGVCNKENHGSRRQRAAVIRCEPVSAVRRPAWRRLPGSSWLAEEDNSSSSYGQCSAARVRDLQTSRTGRGRGGDLNWAGESWGGNR